MTKANHLIIRALWTYAIASPVVFSVGVLILGIFTPGYSHFQHTISRLAVEKYGWIQTINFIQFGIAVSIAGGLIARAMESRQAKNIVARVFLISTIMWLIVALFPTDKIEEKHLSLISFSMNGKIHLGIVFLVFVLFPIGVYKLAQAFRQEKQLRHLARLTEICGYSSGILCFIWTWLLFSNQLFGLGLLQKVIAGICLIWMMRVLMAVKPRWVTDK